MKYFAAGVLWLLVFTLEFSTSIEGKSPCVVLCCVGLFLLSCLVLSCNSMSLCPVGVLHHGFFEGLRRRKDLGVESNSANSTSTTKARSARNYTNLHANLQKQLAKLDDMGLLIIEESVKRVDLAFKEQLGDIFMRVESNECRYKVLTRPYFLAVCLPRVISIQTVFALFWLSWWAWLSGFVRAVLAVFVFYVFIPCRSCTFLGGGQLQ